MNRIISYYDKNAEEFCRATKDADMTFCRDRFLHLLEHQYQFYIDEEQAKKLLECIIMNGTKPKFMENLVIALRLYN